MKYIHSNDSEKMPAVGSSNHDKIYKIRPLLGMIVERFKSVYTPTEYLSVDESIISYKGRLSWIQDMPKKPHKWGIKASILSHSYHTHCTLPNNTEVGSWCKPLNFFYIMDTLQVEGPGQNNYYL